MGWITPNLNTVHGDLTIDSGGALIVPEIYLASNKNSGTPHLRNNTGNVQVEYTSLISGLLILTPSGDTRLEQHIISNQSTVLIASALGANVTSVTPSGNDVRGELTIVMAGALAANTRVSTLTFGVAYTTTPKIILVDQTSAVGIGLVNFYVLAQSTGVSFDIASDQALGAGTYKVDYIVIG